jgi:hypothetical protein
MYYTGRDHAVLLSSFLALATPSLPPSLPPSKHMRTAIMVSGHQPTLSEPFFSLCRLPTPTLQRHNTENSKQVFPEEELRGLSPNFYIHVSLSNLYIPTIGLPAGKVDQSWEYINRSQTHEW